MATRLLLAAMRLFSSNYKNEKEKATNENARFSPYVAFSYKLSNRFIEDMERVNDFITYSNITLKDWVEIYPTK
ncbi:MAG: hypothetical protein IIV57_02125 [Bacteroidaceae bacterium]|nr:hypothetical protein [Bacteroidaceae bacterium]